VRLKLLRQRAGLTQTTVGQALGFQDHVQVSRWETAREVMPSKYVVPLAQLLGCHPGELFAELPHDAELAQIASALPEPERRVWQEVGAAMVRLYRRKK
jgi:transcriptional regulator with XRE-family HTH domain